jgi:hypothetical protein
VSLGSSINAFHDFAGDRVGGNQICYRKAATRSTLVEWLARIANYGTYGIQQIKLWVNRKMTWQIIVSVKFRYA